MFKLVDVLVSQQKLFMDTKIWNSYHLPASQNIAPFFNDLKM